MEIGCEKIRVSHLQYADDTIFTCSGKLENIYVIKDILRNFKLLSGLNVNFNKSSLMGLNMDRANLEHMADVLGCEVGLIHFSYLGLNMGINHKCWSQVVEGLGGVGGE
ncbi:hypothetical protein ACS0TY_013467 [Phlomoides rotata]